MGKEVKFGGFLVSHEGIKPDPKYIESIKRFPTPFNTSKIREFQGMAIQLTFFRPDLPHNLDLLNQLLRKDIAFVWLPDHPTSFNKKKELLTSDLILKHYDPSLPMELISDASKVGLGFLLMNRDTEGGRRLVLCRSRSLSTVEKNYADRRH